MQKLKTKVITIKENTYDELTNLKEKFEINVKKSSNVKAKVSYDDVIQHLLWKMGEYNKRYMMPETKSLIDIYQEGKKQGGKKYGK